MRTRTSTAVFVATALLEWSLLPCRHNDICPTCRFQIAESGCPLWRSKIGKIFFPQTQTTHEINEIVSSKREEEARVASKVFQVVVGGFPGSSKTLFAEAMREFFPLPEAKKEVRGTPMEIDGALFKSQVNSQTSSKRGGRPSSIFKYFENNFSAILRLFGHECRITVVSPSAIDYDFHVHDEVNGLKPDVVVIRA